MCRDAIAEHRAIDLRNRNPWGSLVEARVQNKSDSVMDFVKIVLTQTMPHRIVFINPIYSGHAVVPLLTVKTIEEKRNTIAQFQTSFKVSPLRDFSLMLTDEEYGAVYRASFALISMAGLVICKQFLPLDVVLNMVEFMMDPVRYQLFDPKRSFMTSKLFDIWKMELLLRLQSIAEKDESLADKLSDVVNQESRDNVLNDLRQIYCNMKPVKSGYGVFFPELVNLKGIVASSLRTLKAQ